jgi:hypothetical protein
MDSDIIITPEPFVLPASSPPPHLHNQFNFSHSPFDLVPSLHFTAPTSTTYLAASSASRPGSPSAWRARARAPPGCPAAAWRTPLLSSRARGSGALRCPCTEPGNDRKGVDQSRQTLPLQESLLRGRNSTFVPQYVPAAPRVC